jgi:2,4-dienoyl-CoA reductase-like NADH-dependent reductase (Old Yellow Enzyme family)
VTDIVQVKRLRTIAELRARLDALGLPAQLGVDDEVDPGGPLATPFTVTDGTAGTREVGNRFVVLPMEGWDGTADGRSTDLVRRRWRRFGESGAKLVWGGEAVAVAHDGRANPRQLVIDESTVEDLAALRAHLVDAHVTAHGGDGLVVGLQLTHSGRWSRPDGTSQPRVAHRHPVLDERVAAEVVVMSDDDLDKLVARYVAAAVLAADAGFDFVDVKHCHGYLLHELLSAVDRPGAYGGSFEHRTAFLCRVAAGLRERAPQLAIGVRLSAYDFVPYEAGPDDVGVPVADGRALARFAFGAESSGVAPDLADAHRFLELCRELGIGLVCITAGSPYYTPHIQRPAFFPPSDGYTPPEDPLVGAARMIAATAELARAHPDVAIVGSGYSYLQQWLPHAAQHAVRTGGATAIGIGRGMLSYPHLPADVLGGRPLEASRLCRTFSDCTTAPRNGIVSGCYPLDEHYKASPERIELAAIKKAARKRSRPVRSGTEPAFRSGTEPA